MIATTHRPGSGSGSRRSGITLTEILIAILIMGVGLISLATLFPLGLLRLRLGTQQARSAITATTAINDILSRSLLNKASFRNTWYGLRDPFTQDSLPNTGQWHDASGNGVGALAAGSLLYPANNINFLNGVPKPTGDGLALTPLATGLPVCYDPLWRDITGVAPLPPVQPGNLTFGTTLFNTQFDLKGSYLNPVTPNAEARFGSGIFGSTDTNPGTTPYIDADGTGLASAHGLQRITNFIAWSNVTGSTNTQYPLTCNYALPLGLLPPDVAGNIFASVDDLVYNPTGGEVKNSDGSAASSVLPDMSTGGAQNDYRFTWFFTGRQGDANGNGAQFTGDIVVCDGRPFGFDPLPGLTGAYAPAGETVVEAIFGVGVGASVVAIDNAGTVGYAVNDRTVLLRWKNTLADPQVRVGGWIADVTYERSTAVYRLRVGSTASTFARCHWYQIGKRVDPITELDDKGVATGFRTMTVTLTAPVQTKTLLTKTNGLPVHRNVALIMPSVVNVFSRSFEVH